MITQIVWNGVDTYIKYNGSIYTKKEEFKPFDVEEININTLPIDKDGEINFDGVLGDKFSGKYYKKV